MGRPATNESLFVPVSICARFAAFLQRSPRELRVDLLGGRRRLGEFFQNLILTWPISRSRSDERRATADYREGRRGPRECL
jgi:hypothetical protein